MSTKTDLTLADVDGTVPGRAALMGIRLDPECPEQNHTIFVEGEYDCTDPHDDCQRLLASIENDFPEHVFTTALNPRARYLMWKRRMDALLGGISDNSPQAFLDC